MSFLLICAKGEFQFEHLSGVDYTADGLF